jgi:hypothetical protein
MVTDNKLLLPVRIGYRVCLGAEIVQLQANPTISDPSNYFASIPEAAMTCKEGSPAVKLQARPPDYGEEHRRDGIGLVSSNLLKYG